MRAARAESGADDAETILTCFSHTRRVQVLAWYLCITGLDLGG